MTCEEALAIIRCLPRKQRDELGRICIGDDSCLNAQTARALARKGLINYRLEKVPDDRFGLSLWRADVASIAVHRAWCQWCSETVTEEL